MNWIQYYMVNSGNKEANFLYLWLTDSFATFFFTCCAVTDAFILLISQEHNAAWLMHHQTSIVADSTAPKALASRPSLRKSSSLEDAMQVYESRQTSRGVQLVYEEEVIKDWLLLINDVKVHVAQRAADDEDADCDDLE